ncbi:MAG: L-2-hydroxyglutarate oxidase [Planctomycetota bacterium]
MAEPVQDVVVVGGGIVGLATAWRVLQRDPGRRVVVLEKESGVGRHQTGHNSGVLHSGIYYKPGSLKAKNCRAGKAEMERFCDEHGIAWDRCGKVIVATSERELPALERIFERGQANGVECRRITGEESREIEPNAAAVAAIHVPETGITDYGRVCEKLAELIDGHEHGWVERGAWVHDIEERAGEWVVTAKSGASWVTRLVVNCAGLQSDRVTKRAGHRPGVKIVPFRGEYFELTAEAEHLCRGLIYPVPDPAFPFLGVHFTRMVGGGVECGPNAVLAWGRECYGKYSVSPRDLAESLTYPGFLKMAAKHWRMGAGEMWRSYNKAAFVRALQRLVPAIQAEHLKPAPSGIRAQAVSRDGALVDDFAITEERSVIHVNNAPSPAATASLNIGSMIADRADAQLVA